MKITLKTIGKCSLAALVFFFTISSHLTAEANSRVSSISARTQSPHHPFSFFNGSSRRYAANRLLEPSNDRQEGRLLSSWQHVFSTPVVALALVNVVPAVIHAGGSLALPLRI